LCIGLLGTCSTARAQPGREPSGYEVAIRGSIAPLWGRPVRIRGVAYRVLGLAGLSPLPGAQVEARHGFPPARPEAQPWTVVRADPRGAFELEVPLTNQVSSESFIEMRVGDGATSRTFRFSLRPEPPVRVDLTTDRRLYEPGEEVHVWSRVTDRRSLRPLGAIPAAFSINGRRRSVTTDEGGVAAFHFRLPHDAPEGNWDVNVVAAGQLASHSVRVSARVQQRLFGRIWTIPATVQPGAPVRIAVEARTPSGAPVRDAAVRVTVEPNREVVLEGRTDRSGVAMLESSAPAYSTDDTGFVGLEAQIDHPAHGSLSLRGGYRIAVPLTLQLDAVAPNGGLVPEIDDIFYVTLLDGEGNPPPAGTEVEARGPAVRGGVARVVSDANGIAIIPARLPLGTYVGDLDEGRAVTSVVVTVAGPLARVARLQIAVNPHVEVIPTAARSVLAPGEVLEVSLRRRGDALRRAAIIDVLGNGTVVASRRVGAGQDRVSITLPDGHLGIMNVCAQSIRQHVTEEGSTGCDAVIVRPERPSFPRLEPDRTLYRTGASARLVLHTAPGAPRSFVAISVRDLATHEGEQPFSYRFLDGAVDRAVLDPTSGASGTFLDAALAEYVESGEAAYGASPLLDPLGLPDLEQSVHMGDSENGLGRDPWPRADELRTRAIAPVMRAVEEMLEEAVASDTLGEVTVGTGRSRQFRPDLLSLMSDPPITLGGEPMTVAMIEAADPSFTFDTVARRVARRRLVHVMAALAVYLDPGDDATIQQRMAAREPADRWLARMVQLGMVADEDLADPWGGHMVLRRTPRPAFLIAVEAASYELVSLGPDGVAGTRDDVVDPFARAVPAGTPFAVASGEDDLMRLLARIAPGEAILDALRAAYQRVAAEVSEEEIGNAVAATPSEGDLGFGVGGLGLVGTGGGGGGSGYGRGAGSVPNIRTGAASAAPWTNVVSVLRERFPATLLFVPEMEVDPSGRTEITVALEDALTTYVAEAVVWSVDGWSWSARAELRVDREVVVDAPVPAIAAVGDRLRLPVRVGNRTASARELSVGLLGSDGLAALTRAPRAVTVGASDAVEVPLELHLDRPGRGRLTVAVMGTDGEPLDAVRRPLRVMRPSRRVIASEEWMGRSSGELVVVVPDQAISRPGSRIELQVGPALFGAPADPVDEAWSAAWGGATAPIGIEVRATLTNEEPLRRARALGAGWAVRSVPDSSLASVIRDIGFEVDSLRRRRSDEGAVRELSQLLLALAPAVPRLARRPALAPQLEDLLRDLRARVSSDAIALSDQPDLWALSAAALVHTAPAGADSSRVAELVHRARRHLVRVGREIWLAPMGYGPYAEPTAMLALAELGLGHTDRAFELIRTLRRWAAAGARLESFDVALARASARLLAVGPTPSHARVAVDGRWRRVALEDGVGTVSSSLLGRPGRHVVRLEVPEGMAMFARAVAIHGLPWSVVPRQHGPIRVTIEGDTGGRDDRSGLALVVRNRSARTIGSPVLEIDIPAGAELDELARGLMRRGGVTESDLLGRTLTLALQPLPPGGVRRVPLPVVWSVGGRLGGLGVTSYPRDRPDSVAVLAPRTVTIGEVRP